MKIWRNTWHPASSLIQGGWKSKRWKLTPPQVPKQTFWIWKWRFGSDDLPFALADFFSGSCRSCSGGYFPIKETRAVHFCACTKAFWTLPETTKVTVLDNLSGGTKQNKNDPLDTEKQQSMRCNAFIYVSVHVWQIFETRKQKHENRKVQKTHANIYIYTYADHMFKMG